MTNGRQCPVLAVVGTDTGVGKTVVGAGLIHGLREAGLGVAAFKPVETGLEQGRLPGGRADWERLAEVSGQEPATCLGESYALGAAPLAAARKAGGAVSLERLTEQLRKLRSQWDLVLVEGAGGLCVPFAQGLLWADMLERWAPDCLVVGRLGLGTLNHTLLTLSELDRRGLSCLGAVLNTLSAPGPESQQTPDLIREFSGTPVFAVIPEGCVSPSAVAATLLGSGLLEHLISRYRSG